MPFLRCLVAPVRGGGSVAAAFGSKAMDALARILLAEGGGEAVRDQALPLLADWCQVLNPEVRPRPPRASRQVDSWQRETVDHSKRILQQVFTCRV